MHMGTYTQPSVKFNLRRGGGEEVEGARKERKEVLETIITNKDAFAHPTPASEWRKVTPRGTLSRIIIPSPSTLQA